MSQQQLENERRLFLFCPSRDQKSQRKELINNCCRTCRLVTGSLIGRLGSLWRCRVDVVIRPARLLHQLLHDLTVPAVERMLLTLVASGARRHPRRTAGVQPTATAAIVTTVKEAGPPRLVVASCS